MSSTCDAYYQWLAIPPEDQPPHHHRLLGVKAFESNADVIANAADRQMAHVRSFQAGKHAPQSQWLLNKLAAAWICLLNAEKKQAYDIQLQAPEESAAKLKLVDSWYVLSDQEKGAGKTGLMRRAANGYESASDEFTGLSKTRVEQRLKEICEVIPADPATAPNAADVWLIHLGASEVRRNLMEDLPGPGLFYFTPADPERSQVDFGMRPPDRGSSHAAFELSDKKFRYLVGTAGFTERMAVRATTPWCFGSWVTMNCCGSRNRCRRGASGRPFSFRSTECGSWSSASIAPARPGMPRPHGSTRG